MRLMTKSEFQERMDRIRSELKSVGAFEDNSPQARAERKRRAKADIFEFARLYFPRVFYHDFEDIQKDLIEYAYNPNTLSLVAVFRGFGKSALFSFLVPMHEICFPDLHNMHFLFFLSATELQAGTFSGPIMLNLQENERLKADFGDLFKAGGEMNFETTNEQLVLARGYMQPLRGMKYKGIWRPDRGVIDDFEDDDTVHNPRLVKKRVERIKRVVLPAMSDEGHFLTWVGNVLAKKSAMAQFMDEREEDDLKRKKYPSVMLPILDEQGHATCPGRFPLSKIQAKKRELGTKAFNEEMMMLLTDESDAFQEGWFRYYRPEEISGVPMRVCVGLDASLEEGATHDYRAIIAAGIDSEQRIRVLRAWVRKSSENVMWEALWRILSDYTPSPVAKTGFPQVISLKLVIGGAVTEKHLKDHWMEFCKRRGSCPAYPGFDLQRTSKVARIIDTLSHPVETGDILFPWPIPEDVAVLKEQMLYIDTPAVNDDGPDALQVAVSNLTGAFTKFEYDTIEESRYASMAM